MNSDKYGIHMDELNGPGPGADAEAELRAARISAGASPCELVTSSSSSDFSWVMVQMYPSAKNTL